MLQILFCRMHRKMTLLCGYHINRTEVFVLLQKNEVLQCITALKGLWMIPRCGGIAPARQDISRNA